MKLASGTLCALALAASTLAILPSDAAELETGKITRTDLSSFDFERPPFSCLVYCLEMVGVRQQFECVPYFLPPEDRCDLPWVDSHRPTGVPFGQEDGCIPEDSEFGGFTLFEDVDRVRRSVRHNSDCTTEIHDDELEQLEPLGNPPRPCPDPAMWRESDFTPESIAFVRCN